MVSTRRASNRQRVKNDAKAKTSGYAISSEGPTNTKIVFKDNVAADTNDDEVGVETKADAAENPMVECDNGNDNDDDDPVEEVKGNEARESTQRLRKTEREISKDSSKKRRVKTGAAAKVPRGSPSADVGKENPAGSNGEEQADNNMELTEDFFNKVDAERADTLNLAQREKNKKSLERKNRVGKHTTFVVGDEFTGAVSRKLGPSMEVVVIGGHETILDDEERRNLFSAAVGSSSAPKTFAREGLDRGVSMERGSESRKRRSKNEESWKRSRRMLFGSRPGTASLLFSRRSR